MTMSKSESGKIGGEKSKQVTAFKLQQRIEEYNNCKAKCVNCSCDLEYKDRNNKYCTRSCSVTFSNKKRIKRETLNCLVCNNSLLGKALEQKFCSSECQQSSVKEETWKRLNEDVTYQVSHRHLRSILIYKFGAKCMECGWDKVNQKTGLCPIELEHMDGNHSNNTINNVKLLCPNCHSLTPTYKALNKGNGRQNRNK